MTTTATAHDGFAAYDETFAALRRIEEAAIIALDTPVDMLSGGSSSARPESPRFEFLGETIIGDEKRATAALEPIPIETECLVIGGQCSPAPEGRC